MKIPLYLKVALSATLLLCFYILSGEEDDVNNAFYFSGSETLLSKKNVISNSGNKTDNEINQRVDIFPSQKHKVNSVKQAHTQKPVKEIIKQPDFPYSVVGAVWLQQERVLLLKDNVNSWTICQRCKSKNKIWDGYLFDDGWKLVRVNQHVLIFRMENGRYERRIVLNEFKTKPNI